PVDVAERIEEEAPEHLARAAQKQYRCDDDKCGGAASLDDDKPKDRGLWLRAKCRDVMEIAPGERHRDRSSRLEEVSPDHSQLLDEISPTPVDDVADPDRLAADEDRVHPVMVVHAERQPDVFLEQIRQR